MKMMPKPAFKYTHTFQCRDVGGTVGLSVEQAVKKWNMPSFCFILLRAMLERAFKAFI